MENKTKIYIFTAVFIAALIITLLILSWPSLTGKTFILATQPVDPFDIFRGQYLSINYDISRISNLSDYGISVSPELVGESIYAILEKDSLGIERAKGYSLAKPTSGDFIKGQIKYAYGGSVFVSYGIEQYFFEKNAQFSTQNITVEVKVSDAGRATISKLYRNGKPLGLDYTQNIQS